jgi:hypothetical protein
MSHALTSRSPDLKRLRDEGFDVSVTSGYLLVREVPYVNARREISRGTLVSKLTVAGDITRAPDDHVMLFAGDYPCNKDGTPIEQIRNSSHPGQRLAEGVVVDHRFSAKPPGGRYPDHYEKVITYARILGAPAEALDATVSARVFPVVKAEDTTSVFEYMDTASSRAEIVDVADKLALSKVAIVGLGGTGSYVLDLVAKTPVREIHLIDGDEFHQHNAFRAPGAPSRDELESKPLKVDHFKRIYSRMHRHVHTHPYHLTCENLHLVEEMSFVFLCFDGGPVKKAAVEMLVEGGIPFVDVGMGLHLVDGAVTGLLRVTASTKDRYAHAVDGTRIPFSPPEGDDEYSTNIQVADLNALNAALAVIRWKKHAGFYLDLEGEHHSTYSVNGNEMTNEEAA